MDSLQIKMQIERDLSALQFYGILSGVRSTPEGHKEYNETEDMALEFLKLLRASGKEMTKTLPHRAQLVSAATARLEKNIIRYLDINRFQLTKCCLMYLCQITMIFSLKE
jgi:sugar phosphate isomerase/epimerase